MLTCPDMLAVQDGHKEPIPSCVPEWEWSCWRWNSFLHHAHTLVICWWWFLPLPDVFVFGIIFMVFFPSQNEEESNCCSIGISTFTFTLYGIGYAPLESLPSSACACVCGLCCDLAVVKKLNSKGSGLLLLLLLLLLVVVLDLILNPLASKPSLYLYLSSILNSPSPACHSN